MLDIIELPIPNKKRNAPLRFSHLDLLLKRKFYCHKIFISDQILQNHECDVDEYLYLPCTGKKLTKANGKRVSEALFQ